MKMIIEVLDRPRLAMFIGDCSNYNRSLVQYCRLLQSYCDYEKWIPSATIVWGNNRREATGPKIPGTIRESRACEIRACKFTMHAPCNSTACNGNFPHVQPSVQRHAMHSTERSQASNAAVSLAVKHNAKITGRRATECQLVSLKNDLLMNAGRRVSSKCARLQTVHPNCSTDSWNCLLKWHLLNTTN